MVLCPNTPLQIAFRVAVMDLSTLENEFTEEGMLPAPINGNLQLQKARAHQPRHNLPRSKNLTEPTETKLKLAENEFFCHNFDLGSLMTE